MTHSLGECTEVLSAANLFDLSAFQHTAFLLRQEHVWTALARLEEYLLSLKLGVIEGRVDKGAFLEDSHLITLGKGSVVEAGAYIKGPCYIGENCQVRHGAYIRGTVLAGNLCVLGHDSEFKNAILLDRAQAPHFNYVGDSILGNRVNLGAGTICANLRFDQKDIVVAHGERRYRTHMRKLGAIFGDEAETGCNSVINPGTVFGKKARCWPSSNVSGVIPSETTFCQQEAHSVVPNK